jgi:hypothetical protein
MEDAMATKLGRQSFLIKDLAVSIGGGSGGGGTWMPGEDTVTPPTPISPIASVMVNMGLIEAVRATIAEAVKAKKFDDVGRAFMAGDTGGNAAIRAAIQEVGTAIVASAAYAGLGGGSAGMPDPNCGGTSMETIPTPLTPVVHIGRQVHRVTDLPRLRKQLGETVAFLDNAAAAQAPRGAEVRNVRAQLEGALKALPA